MPSCRTCAADTTNSPSTRRSNDASRPPSPTSPRPSDPAGRHRSNQHAVAPDNATGPITVAPGGALSSRPYLINGTVSGEPGPPAADRPSVLVVDEVNNGFFDEPVLNE